MSMFGSSGGDSSEEEELQAAALVASMGRKCRGEGRYLGTGPTSVTETLQSAY